MSVVQEHEDTEPPSADSVVARLDEILQELAGAVLDSSLVSDAARIDRIARLEKLRAVTAALQAAESVRFAQSQAAEQIAADVHPDALGRGIADQIGLACRISPFAAARRLNVARVLWFELPDTYGQLVAGELHERVAENIVTETRHLDPEMRRQVDEQLKTAGIARWDSRPLRHVPARPRTRPIARVMCSGPHRAQTSPGWNPASTRHHVDLQRLPPRRAGRRLLRRAAATRRRRRRDGR